MKVLAAILRVSFCEERKRAFRHLKLRKKLRLFIYSCNYKMTIIYKLLLTVIESSVLSVSVFIYSQIWEGGKCLPNMNKFCDWLSETKVIRVHDSFF